MAHSVCCIRLLYVESARTSAGSQANDTKSRTSNVVAWLHSCHITRLSSSGCTTAPWGSSFPRGGLRFGKNVSCWTFFPTPPGGSFPMRKGRSCPACRSSLLGCGCRSEVSRVLRRCRASPFSCRTSSRSSQSERSVNAFMRCASARFRSHFVWRCAIGLLSGIDVRADGEFALRRGTRLLGNHPVRDLCKGAV